MNIHPLTPIENDIVIEICRFLAARGDGSPETMDVIGILACWGDSLPEEDIVSLLRALNAHVQEGDRNRGNGRLEKRIHSEDAQS